MKYSLAFFLVAATAILVASAPTNHPMVSHSTAPHSTAPHPMVSHSTAPHSTAPHSTAPHSTAPHSTVSIGPDHNELNRIAEEINELSRIAEEIAALDRDTQEHNELNRISEEINELSRISEEIAELNNDEEHTAALNYIKGGIDSLKIIEGEIHSTVPAELNKDEEHTIEGEIDALNNKFLLSRGQMLDELLVRRTAQLTDALKNDALNTDDAEYRKQLYDVCRKIVIFLFKYDGNFHEFLATTGIEIADDPKETIHNINNALPESLEKAFKYLHGNN